MTQLLRVSTLIWVLLVAGSGYAMFQVKNTVARLEGRLIQIDRQIADDNEQIRLLKVEWAVLNQPRRLEELSGRVLALSPIHTNDLGSLDRPPRAPAMAGPDQTSDRDQQ
jgi:hypothetical protein